MPDRKRKKPHPDDPSETPSKDGPEALGLRDMFEVAELGTKMAKAEYEELLPDLRTRLLTLQRRLVSADFPVLILLNGVDGAGRGETANLLTEWLDARHVHTHAFGPPTEEELQRPEHWRYWMALPPRGKVGVYVGNWYTTAILGRVMGGESSTRLAERIEQIREFERTLADDGALLVKLWFHLSRRRQKKRLEKLESDPATAWRVTRAEKKRIEHYGEIRTISDQVLRATHGGTTPWVVVEGTDPRHRNVTVARTLLDAIGAHLRERGAATPATPAESPIADPLTVLDRVDLAHRIDKADYQRRLGELQGRLNQLARRVAAEGRSVILVFEGWDAAGKGGAIRRLLQALDARQVRVIPVAAPTDEERSYHYLWRFWRHLPRRGRFTIYDRSWYGRVLVERVEGFATTSEWRRAYGEINAFERQLTEDGRTALVKFWLHISKDEQLRRFEERKRVPYKQHKITDEDYRNREKWNRYERAAADMVGYTSTRYAPWTLVAAESKHLARISVIETVCERIEALLD